MYKTIIKPTLVLTIISVVISALLALTYNLTGLGNASTGIPQEELDVYGEVALPGASLKAVKFESQFVVKDLTLLGVYADENGNGFALHFSAKGYSKPDSIKMLVGYDANGAIAGIYPISSEETPNLGTMALEPGYLANYIGVTGPVTIGEDLDAVAGATLTSKAMANAISSSFEYYNEVKGGLAE